MYTFDDGYADNAEIALPILKKYSAVVTFFVSAGVIDGGKMWNDPIIESIRHAQGDILDLTQLGMGNHSIKSLAERQKVLILLIEKLKYMPQEQRQENCRQVKRTHRVKITRRSNDDIRSS